MPGSVGEHRLQKRYGTEFRARSFLQHQVLDHLNGRMQEFVARMEMVFIATADGAREADCSFRAGPPGFVRALDERTLIYPEYRGNGVMGSLGNISESGHIGLLFLDFCGDGIGLHVNGRAAVVENTELKAGDPLLAAVLDDLVQERGRRPERWVRVNVEQAYVHCSKHIPRLAKRSPARSGHTEHGQRASGDYFDVAHSFRPRNGSATRDTGGT